MSEQQGDERLIRAEIRTTASPEIAWQAWADPRQLAKWFVDAARGEAKAGGTITWVWEEFGVEVPYEVRVVEPPRRLVLATPEQVAPPGIIEITIASDAGATVITVVNSGFQTEGALDDPALTFQEGTNWGEVFEGIRSGWQMTLALLKEYLERYENQEKRTFIVMKPAEIEARDALSWFTEEHRLVQWLTRAGAPASPGGTFSLELHDGSVFEGGQSRGQSESLRWPGRHNARFWS
jgi:uncharacterized protein YndB with AHSA1/START domain